MLVMSLPRVSLSPLVFAFPSDLVPALSPSHSLDKLVAKADLITSIVLKQRSYLGPALMSPFLAYHS